MSDQPMGDPFPIRFPTRTASRLAAAATRLGMSKTAAVRAAVDEWLARVDAADTRTEQETN
jgi:hypothetical protein